MLDFTITTPTTAIGAGTPSRAITLTTTGGSTLSTTSFALSDGGAGGVFFPASPVTIAAGASGSTTQFVYIPPAASALNTTITITATATGGITSVHSLALPIGVASVLAYDSFTGTANTDLGSHAPDLGTSWTKQTAGTLGNTLALTGAGALYVSGTSGTAEYVVGVASGTEVDVSAIIQVIDNTHAEMGPAAFIHASPTDVDGYWYTEGGPAAAPPQLNGYNQGTGLGGNPISTGVGTIAVGVHAMLYAARAINGSRYHFCLLDGAIVGTPSSDSTIAGTHPGLIAINTAAQTSANGHLLSDYFVRNPDWTPPATFPNNNVFQSPYNWVNSGGSATTTTPGPYLKGFVTGTTQITATLDTTLNSGIGVNNMPALKCVAIDWTATDEYGRPGVAGPWINVAIPSNNTVGVPLTLASGLTSGHLYEYVVWSIGNNGNFTSSYSAQTGWTKFLSLSFDSGAVLSPCSRKPKTAVFLGDSNIEGYYGESQSQAPYLYLDASTVWPVYVSEGLQAELMVRGIGGQGWVYNGASFGFPTLPNSWNKLSSGHTIDFTSPGPPDYLFSVMGDNDHGQSGPAVQAAVTAWIASVRGTAGCGACWIFVCIPPNQMQASYIKAGVVAAGDPKAVTLDLGTDEFSTGTNFFGSTASFMSPDGLHLSRTYHGVVAGVFARQAQKAIDAQSVLGQFTFSNGLVNAQFTAFTATSSSAAAGNPGNGSPFVQSFNCVTGAYWSQSITITGLVSTGWTQYVWTLKGDAALDSDSEALVCIRVTNGGAMDDGLLINNGRPGTAANASLSVTETTPDTGVTWTLQAAALDVPPSPQNDDYWWELTRWIGSQKEVVGSGRVVLTRSARRAVTAP